MRGMDRVSVKTTDSGFQVFEGERSRMKVVKRSLERVRDGLDPTTTQVNRQGRPVQYWSWSIASIEYKRNVRGTL